MNPEKIIELEGKADEAGFISERMSEKEFESRVEKFGGVISRIRIKDMTV